MSNLFELDSNTKEQLNSSNIIGQDLGECIWIGDPLFHDEDTCTLSDFVSRNN